MIPAQQTQKEMQSAFSGGMQSRLSADAIGPEQYVYGRNLEVRDGVGRTRRGWTVLPWYPNPTGMGSFKDAAVYRSRYGYDSVVTVIGDLVFRQPLPCPCQTMSTLAAVPSGGLGDRVFLVQAFDRLYMLRGPEPPIRWLGTGNAWEALAAPETGDECPETEYGIYAYNRLWVATDGDSLAASDLLSEEFDLTNHIWEVDEGEGGAIVAMCAWAEGSILVFKTNSVWQLTGCNGDLSGLMAQKIDGRNGCVASRSVVHVGNDVWFLSHDGIRSVVMTGQNKAQLVDVPASDSLASLVSTLNVSESAWASAQVVDNYVVFGVVTTRTDAVAGAAFTCLVYDLVSRAWLGEWCAESAETTNLGRFLVVTTNGVQRLVSVDHQAKCRAWLADCDTDVNDTFTLGAVFDGSGYVNLLPIWTAYYGGPIPGLGDSTVTIDFVISATALDFARCLWSFQHTVGGLVYFVVACVTTAKQVNVVAGSYVPGGPTAGVAWNWVSTPTVSQRDWHRLCVHHNGTTPSFALDGQTLDGTFTAATDKTFWLLSTLTDTDAVARLSNTLSIPAVGAFYGWKGQLAHFSLYAVSGDTPTMRAFLALSETSGSTAACYPLGVCTLGGTTAWSTYPSDGNIPMRLKTRAFNGTLPDAQKVFLDGTLSVQARSAAAHVVDAVVDGRTTRVVPHDGVGSKSYSPTVYDLHDRAAYDLSVANFMLPHRQDYGQMRFTGSGVFGAATLRLGMETEHTEHFCVTDAGRTCQLDLQATSGSLAVRALSLTSRASSVVRRNV